jgi:multicomponent Na+:H+ antiporter subunit A
LIAILALFAAVGVLLIALGSRIGRVAFLIAALPPAVSVMWVCSQLGLVIDQSAVVDHTSWVRDLGLSLDFRLDAMAATMTLIVSGIGVLTLLYAWQYFAAETPDLARLAGLLVLFAGAMVGLVQADHLILLYTCWELTSVTSYLLIGNRYTDADARAAALHALLVTGAGGLAMLAGFVLLGQSSGTYRLSELATRAPTSGPTVTVALVLILLGAFTKSAQYPFHSWLPAAMAAPTPVSAYLHSAAMVKAGVYLVARLAPIFATVAVWRPTVLAVGLATMLAAGLRAMRQHDLKLLLAFGTVSQLGFMIVMFGAGTPAATTAGWMLLVGHAMFKAALFMVVGILDRRTDTRDIRELPLLDGRWRWVEVITVISTASMIGLPLAVGFIAKEGGYEAFAGGPFNGSGLVLAGLVVGSMLTVAYGVRFWWGAFVDPRRRAKAEVSTVATAQPPAPGWLFITPAVGLVVGTVVLGVAPSLADSLATAAVRSLDPRARPAHLALWHGFNLPLALSALTLAGGALIAIGDRGVQRVLIAGSAIPDGAAVFLSMLRALGATARRITGVVQNGSLPIYCGVILSTAAILPAATLLRDWEWPGWPKLGELSDLPIAAALVLVAFGAASIRRRFSAALFLGAAGYAMAALFVVYGAPDLALTQVTVETLSTVVFVLVLRRLPDRFERQSTKQRRAVRLVVAGLVGATVFVFAIVAAASRTAIPVSEEIINRSVPDGHGRNVVNVILVDFRGLDTLGEITVLAVASIGAVALARVGHRASAERSRRTSARVDEAVHRIVFVDVSVRVIFHVVLMASLWLLFAGHNQPGGGFVGGLLAGSAFTLRFIAGGMTEVRRHARFRPWTVLGAGLVLAASMAAFPILGGGAVLDVASKTLSLPVIGDVAMSSAVVFDIGVYLTVVGVVLMAFEAFGDEHTEVHA